MQQNHTFHYQVPKKTTRKDGTYNCSGSCENNPGELGFSTSQRGWFGMGMQERAEKAPKHTINNPRGTSGCLGAAK